MEGRGAPTRNEGVQGAVMQDGNRGARQQAGEGG